MYTIYLGPIHPQHPPHLAPVKLLCGAQGSKNRVTNSLELAGYAVTSHRVGARKWTQVLSKSSKCSYLMSDPSSPQTVFPDETMNQLLCPFPSVSPVYPAMNWTFPKICISHQKATCLLHWLVLTVHSAQPRIAWEGEPQLRNCPDQIVPPACQCGIFWAVSWCRRARPLWAAPFPGQVIQRYVRKLAEAWACEQGSRHAASSMVPVVFSGCEVSLLIGVNDVWTGKQACLEFPPCLPSVTDCDLGL